MNYFLAYLAVSFILNVILIIVAMLDEAPIIQD